MVGAMRTLALWAIVLAACGHGAATPATDAPAGEGSDGAPGADAPAGTTHSVAIVVEPDGMRGQQLVDAIAGAQRSVYVTMYELSDSAVIGALAARAQAGVDVQVVLDGSSATKSFNTPAFTQLANAGASVVWSNARFTYTHEKTVIVDGEVAWIMTMNGTTTAPRENREYLAIDSDPADVAEATEVFDADHAGQVIVPNGGLVVANANARPDLVALIDGATTTLDVEGEEFSDTTATGVVKAVARAAQRGVAVHVVVANGGIDATAVSLVKSAGGRVVMTGPASGSGTATNPYIHAKAIVVDCPTAATCRRGFVGSENFSATSLGYNRELGVIFDAASELAKVKTAIDHDFAAGTAQ